MLVIDCGRAEGYIEQKGVIERKAPYLDPGACEFAVAAWGRNVDRSQSSPIS